MLVISTTSCCSIYLVKRSFAVGFFSVIINTHELVLKLSSLSTNLISTFIVITLPVIAVLWLIGLNVVERVPPPEA